MKVLVDCRTLPMSEPKGTENFVMSLVQSMSPYFDLITVDVQAEDTIIVKRRFDKLANVKVIADPVAGFWKKAVGGTRYKLLRALVFRLDRVLKKFGFGLLAPRKHWAQSQHADVVYYPTHIIEPQHDIPRVSTVHAVLEGYKPWELTLTEMHMKNSACVVTSWPHPRADLCRRFPFAKNRLFMIPFVIAHLGDDMAKDILKRFDLPEDYYFYPAVSVPRKNHEVVIRGLRVLKDRGATIPDMVFTGGGDDACLKQLTDLASSLGVEDKVYFLGHVNTEEMCALYTYCRAGLCASFSEAGIAVIQEGVARGKPVLCSDTPEARAHAGMYDLNACFFDPNSPDDFADKVHLFEVQFDRFCESAQQSAPKVRAVTPEYMAQCYAEVIKYVARQTSRPQWFPFKNP